MNTIIKVPWPQPKSSVFTAFKWDMHLISTYETIFKSLQAKKEYKNLTFKYGSKDLPYSIKSLGVTEFVNRNRQLYEIFVAGIEASDIFIADITGQNPNVMLELGIAMRLNKNILILKQKNKEERFPFDIQGIHIQEYTSIKELEKNIFDFINMFSRIRNQTFGNYIPERHQRISEIQLVGTEYKTLSIIPKKARNLLIKLTYKFLDHVNTKDWIGIHLRTQGPDRGNSELIYSRVNGELELLSWPSYKPPKKADSRQPSGKDFISISLIENEIKAKTNSKVLKPSETFANEYGTIMIMSQAHSPEPGLEKHKLIVECTDIEVVNLDTTSSTQ